MRIHILSVGKTKFPWCREGEEHYEKLLGALVQLKRIEIGGESVLSAVSPEEVKKREGRKILEKIPPGIFTVILSEEGKRMDSRGFSELFARVQEQEGGECVFVMGGPLGLADEVKKNGDLLLSFSDFTFPHDLIRILLLEQIYRAVSILSGRKYHK